MKTTKQELLEKLNNAFARNDTRFIIEHVTDDIEWNVVGEPPIRGKEEFIISLNEMKSEEPFELTTGNIITHGDSAAVDGVMRSAEGIMYAFCDLYKLKGSKEPKVSKITSYVIEIKSETSNIYS